MAKPADRLFVGTVRSKADLALIHDEHWYRVPVSTIRESELARWPPQWFAGWVTATASGGSGQRVAFVAPVVEVANWSREQLFPLENPGARRGKRYYRLALGEVQPLVPAIVTPRRRAAVFINTSLEKLFSAATLNDLWDDSPLEDEFWNGLKRIELPAERQWAIRPSSGMRRILDFAVFCNRENVAVEIDGMAHHRDKEKSLEDSRRDTQLQSEGWKILRFDEERITYDLGGCLDELANTIDHSGGLADDGLSPRRWTDSPGSHQLRLFEP